MKTRSVHKRYLEKRRRTRKHKQKGGGEEATSVGEWIGRVKESPAFTGGPRVLGELQDPYLKLPGSGDEYILAFDLKNGAEPENRVDIRQEGAAVRDFLKDSVSRLPQITPSQFQQYIMEVRRSEIGDANDIVDSMMFMVRLENAMRSIADVPLLEETADELANSEKYPLFLWALIQNTPENVDPGFSTIQEPAQQEESAS